MIQCEAFHIEPLSLQDVKGIHNLMRSNADSFINYLPKTLEQNLTIQTSQKFVNRKVEQHLSKDEFLFTLKEKTRKKLIGLIYIKELDWNKKQGEFAYCIDSKYEGKGWMTQSIKLLSNYAFNDLGLEKLQIIAHKNNTGSIRVAKNCDFLWQKTLINEFTPHNGKVLDMELYELNKK